MTISIGKTFLLTKITSTYTHTHAHIHTHAHWPHCSAGINTKQICILKLHAFNSPQRAEREIKTNKKKRHISSREKIVMHETNNLLAALLAASRMCVCVAGFGGVMGKHRPDGAHWPISCCSLSIEIVVVMFSLDVANGTRNAHTNTAPMFGR